MCVRLLISIISLLFLSPLDAKSHRPQEFLQKIKGNTHEGEQIYSHYCSNCHNPKPLIALNAPVIGNKKDWSIRLKQGLAILFKHTDEGLNAMPPRGGCFECSDEQLMLAILAMLPKEKPTKNTNSKN